MFLFFLSICVSYFCFPALPSSSLVFECFRPVLIVSLLGLTRGYLNVEFAFVQLCSLS